MFVSLNRQAGTNNPLLWSPAQRKRATMLYFANVILFIYFFMAALFSGPS